MIRLLPVYAVLVLLQFTAAAGLTAIYSMLSTLYAQYGHEAGAGWAVTCYLLVAAVASAVCGRLGDLLGRRFVSLIVLAIAGFGALVSASTPGLMGLVAGCALQGTAGALTPLALGLARELLKERRVPLAVGIITAAGTAGAGVAYLGVGFVIDHYGVRGGFLLKAALAALSIIALIVVVRGRRRESGALAGVDLWRGGLFAPAIALVLVAVEKIGTWGWGDLRVSGGLASGLALLAYWARHQYRERAPLIDVRLLLQPRIAIANLTMVGVALGCMQFGQLFSLLLQQPTWTGAGLGWSATSLGWFMLSLNWLAVIVGPAAGVIGRRHGALRAGLWGACFSIAAWMVVATWHATIFELVAGSVLVMIGLSLIFPAVYLLIVESVPAARTSEATGMASVVHMTFMGVGAQIIFALLAMHTVRDSARSKSVFPADASYTLTFTFVVAACVSCLIALLALRRMSRRAAI